MVLRLKASVLSLVFWLLVVTLFGKFCVVDTLKCHIGYGQRGLRHSNEISWTRDCPKAPYCFEAVTSDVNRIKNLIDYPWVRLKNRFPYSLPSIN
jgi:hypothetical protein